MSTTSCSKNQKCHGPGYLSPRAALTDGPREKVLYVTCVNLDRTKPDYLAVVNVDPDSKQCGTVVDRCPMKNVQDELHHSGWNTCSSCYQDSSKCRNRMILPCLNSDRIYVVKVGTESGSCVLERSIEPSELHKLDLSAPHTVHCLPNGHVMISCLGDGAGNGKGSFLLLNGETFEPVPTVWNKSSVPFGYDFWYQPKFDVLVSSEWGSPKAFRLGFDPKMLDKEFGTCLHFWQWTTGKLMKTIDLKEISPGTSMPLEVRFVHDPNRSEGYVGCALSGNIFRFYLDGAEWKAQEVIRIPSKALADKPDLPALITDILISLDDRFLYCSCWAFGEVRQYDITGKIPKLVGTVRIGGLVPTDPKLLTKDLEPLSSDQIVTKIKSIPIQGGAQMLQLSLDGQRLYVTNSLHSAWDQQFYPGMIEKGSQLVKIDVHTDGGGMKVDQTFLVDFRAEPDGPSLAHEMRYPGGDCTSDIWL